jgi:uncharacterized membrane protein YjjP (DUF1212 family)
MSSATAGRPAAISDNSRRTLARLGGASILIISSLAMLVAGIVIGNAARRRFERMSHAHP